MKDENIPKELFLMTSGENIDFVIKPNSAYSMGKGILGAILAIVFIFIVLIYFSIGFSYPFYNVDSLSGDMFFFIILILFTILYIYFFVLSKRAYYIGTPKRMIIYKAKKHESINWDQFYGEIIVQGNEENGTIILTLRTGKMISTTDSITKVFVNDRVYIIGIKNATYIANLCRKRIKENTPTPLIGNRK